MKRFLISLLPNKIKTVLKWHYASNQLIQGDGLWAKNAKYDMETMSIMKTCLSANAIAIDVGAGIGEITAEMTQIITKGKVHAFEPLPVSFYKLQERFKNQDVCQTYHLALSDEVGSCDFSMVEDNLGYSGLKQTTAAKEKYGSSVKKIKIYTNTIDSMIPQDEKVDFIKIDVEGAEYLVLKGGQQTINRSKPIIVFEFDSHAKTYGVDPKMLFDLLEEMGLYIYNTEYYLQGKNPLDLQSFEYQYKNGYEFYFVAASENLKNPKKNWKFSI